MLILVIFSSSESGNDVTNGVWDTYLTTIGNKVKAWNVKIFFTFHHEPDLASTQISDLVHIQITQTF